MYIKSESLIVLARENIAKDGLKEFVDNMKETSKGCYLIDERMFNKILTFEDNVEIHHILFICGFISSEK